MNEVLNRRGFIGACVALPFIPINKGKEVSGIPAWPTVGKIRLKKKDLNLYNFLHVCNVFNIPITQKTYGLDMEENPLEFYDRIRHDTLMTDEGVEFTYRIADNGKRVMRVSFLPYKTVDIAH